jgi:hypothetical protein
MDLLYLTQYNIDQTKKGLEKKGFHVKDASDLIHSHRIAVYYSYKQEKKYKKFLKEHNLLNSSMSFRVGN